MIDTQKLADAAGVLDVILNGESGSDIETALLMYRCHSELADFALAQDAARQLAALVGELLEQMSI